MEELKKEFEEALKRISNQEELKQLKAAFVGKKGKITALFKKLKELSDDEKKEFGKRINELKEFVEEKVKEKQDELFRKAKLESLQKEAIDITLPGRTPFGGGIHPITKTIMEIEDIFRSMGFSVEVGPEIELDLFNFELLNIPKEHPARDMQDTFYINDNVVLRTHTSPTQIRVMKREKPPVMFISPGRVYRRDSDLTHSPMFHQVEGLLVDRNVRFSDLKGVLIEFLRKFFGDVPVRFRPSYFPFTEPSAEVDIGCVICGGKGCRVCSYTGYLEVLGCGMVHPNVLKNVGYDTDRFNGFAFGLGVERFAMLKYGIDNIRLFFENDIRFLEQFSFAKGRVL
ncbi:phenylalanine--tRNA ligase subunit alpha [Hippea alviniae]|uniref:phenylalanine--tRNA ligase subunit alpha n=1 Tax=Hippea alviniae TaxID=1279027 RepID=UPI0003B5B12E|nr:phenylalanine--tRNA ligase subunit alpha [Hippea alviniae]